MSKTAFRARTGATLTRRFLRQTRNVVTAWVHEGFTNALGVYAGLKVEAFNTVSEVLILNGLAN